VGIEMQELMAFKSAELGFESLTDLELPDFSLVSGEFDYQFGSTCSKS
jgi:hypothetical protein